MIKKLPLDVNGDPPVDHIRVYVQVYDESQYGYRETSEHISFVKFAQFVIDQYVNRPRIAPAAAFAGRMLKLPVEVILKEPKDKTVLGKLEAEGIFDHLLSSLPLEVDLEKAADTMNDLQDAVFTDLDIYMTVPWHESKWAEIS